MENVEKAMLEEITKNGKFDSNQIVQIKCGFSDGLTKEQIGIYANTQFSANQMR